MRVRCLRVAGTPRQLAEVIAREGDVGRILRAVEGSVEQPAGLAHLASQLGLVGKPGERRQPGRRRVRVPGCRQGLVVAAELRQGVDPYGEGLLAVRIDVQRPVGPAERAGKVVAGGGQRATARGGGVIVP